MGRQVQQVREGWSAVESLREPLDVLAGVGPKRAASWRAAGVSSLLDLLLLIPRRTREFPQPVAIADLAADAEACIRGVLRSRSASSRHRRAAHRLVVEDDSGCCQCLLFGPGYLTHSFAIGEEVVLVGRLREQAGGTIFQVREVLRPGDLTAGGAVPPRPEYALPAGIPPRTHRACLREAWERCQIVLQRTRLRSAQAMQDAPDLGQVLAWLHFPTCAEEASRARRILVVEEAVRVQLGLRRMHRRRSRVPPDRYRDLAGLLSRYRRHLPFELTQEQSAAAEEVAGDLARDRCMARLLTGDVGTGKTAVAFLPLIAAACSGRQAALLAPTEILARQHFAGLQALFSAFGLSPPLLVSGGAGAQVKKELLDAARTPVAVGTHRLFGAKLAFADLAAVVIDEQHKFGVRQRFHLWAKGRRPDLLMVSATPIPRTLALTLFGHLDLSVLAERPFGKRTIATELLTGEERASVAERIRAELLGGGKVFVVCPAIDSGRRESGLPSALEVSPWLSERLGPDLASCVEVLHGRQDGAQKCAILERFVRGDTRVLVSTVVVEVGVDVPDASLAVILGAERFGLSQLHQIRGRVGRRGAPARCLLVSAEPSVRARARLLDFCGIDDGFILAEKDMQLRGPGDVFGVRQHGLFDTRFPEVLTDPVLIQHARRLTQRLEDRKPVLGKRFGADGVATHPWIW